MQSVTFEPEASSKEALCKVYKKSWQKMPLVEREMTLHELNQKINEALLSQSRIYVPVSDENVNEIEKLHRERRNLKDSLKSTLYYGEGLP